MNLLTAEKVSEKLGVTKLALAQLRRRDASFPPPIRLSRKVLRWEEADIDNWVEGKRRDALAATEKLEALKESTHDG